MSKFDRAREFVEDNRDTVTCTVLGAFVGVALENVVRAVPLIGPVIPSGWGGPLGGALGASIGLSSDAERKRTRSTERVLGRVVRRAAGE